MYRFKSACSDPQPHPPNFFSNIHVYIMVVEIFGKLALEVGSYLEGSVCEVACAKSGLV